MTEKHHNKFRTLLAMVSILAAPIPGAGAATLIDSFTNPDPFNFDGTVTIGYQFKTPATPILVTDLGFWDDDSDGFASDVEVGLFSDDGTMLGQVTILAAGSSSLVDGFRYEPLDTPITLAASTPYVIGGFRGAGVPYSALNTDEGVDFTVSPGFDILEERASSSSGGEEGLTYPAFAFNPNQALIGPNLDFKVIPEPSAAIFLAVAAAGLGWIRRRR